MGLDAIEIQIDLSKIFFSYKNWSSVVSFSYEDLEKIKNNCTN